MDKRARSPDGSDEGRAAKRARTDEHPEAAGTSDYHGVFDDSKPDFAALAAKYEFLRPFVVGHSLDFSNGTALRALTRAILAEDYALDVELPADRLCPIVPSRANYLHWIEGLIASNAMSGRRIRGLDIGVGASCVYPLLGARLYGWHFVGTEVDAHSLRVAQRNIDSNALGASVSLRAVGEPSTVLFGVVDPGERFDFCMCNPPFYASAEDAAAGARSDFVGAPTEMHCDGGEVAFIERMVDDSLILRDSIRWYTTLCGFKSSVKAVKRRLHAAGVQNVLTTEIAHGRTRRWAVGWSFVLDERDMPAGLAPTGSVHEPPRAAQAAADSRAVALAAAHARAQAEAADDPRREQWFAVNAPSADDLLATCMAVLSHLKLVVELNDTASSLVAAVLRQDMPEHRNRVLPGVADAHTDPRFLMTITAEIVAGDARASDESDSDGEAALADATNREMWVVIKRAHSRVETSAAALFEPFAELVGQHVRAAYSSP